MRRARRGRTARWVWPVVVLMSANLIGVMTAANSVPPSHAGNQVDGIEANDLKPDDCAALNLTAVIGGSALIGGTAASELMLGSELPDTIDGGGGDDCIVGGPGGDNLTGGGGTDICIGGDGLDTFLGCETAIQ